MENGAIPDDQITVSSKDTITQSADPSTCCQPGYARLNYNGRWKPNRSQSSAKRWIQIDLRATKIVTGVITQGSGYWVKKIKVMYENPAGSGQIQYIKNDDGSAKVCAIHQSNCCVQCPKTHFILFLN